MSNIPKVSVCIPTYNRSQYLREAIESVLMQSFTDFELIICDNASVDDTSEIVNSFSDVRILYHRNPKNIGSFKNHNLCLKLAKGEYITIFHDDDIMEPENLIQKVSFLDVNSNISLVSSNVNIIDENGNHVRVYWDKNIDHNDLKNTKSYFERLFLEGNHIIFSSVMIRKVCVDFIGEFEEIPYCDWEYWMRVSLFYDLAYLKEPLLKYRSHFSNDSHRYIPIIEGDRAIKSVCSKYSSQFSFIVSLNKIHKTNYAKYTIDLSWRYLKVKPQVFLYLIFLSLQNSFIYSLIYLYLSIIDKSQKFLIKHFTA